MKTHYYMGWFSDGFSEKLSRLLREDITDRSSLVMISAIPPSSEPAGTMERSWLDRADIIFEEYHVLDSRVQKEDAASVIAHASVIFLLGGDPLLQNRFLHQNNLMSLIQESQAVVIGASAGAINMSAQWFGSKRLGFAVEKDTFFNGIGLDDFSVLSHFDLENNRDLVMDELSPLSEEMDIYASNKDCAVRTKGDRIDIVGKVYLISHSNRQLLRETL